MVQTYLGPFERDRRDRERHDKLHHKHDEKGNKIDGPKRQDVFQNCVDRAVARREKCNA